MTAFDDFVHPEVAGMIGDQNVTTGWVVFEGKYFEVGGRIEVGRTEGILLHDVVELLEEIDRHDVDESLAAVDITSTSTQCLSLNFGYV